MSLFQRIVAALASLFESDVDSRRRADEAYLSQAIDIVDLENRMRTLERARRQGALMG